VLGLIEKERFPLALIGRRNQTIWRSPKLRQEPGQPGAGWGRSQTIPGLPKPDAPKLIVEPQGIIGPLAGSPATASQS